MLVKTTGPVYNKTWQNPVAFHHFTPLSHDVFLKTHMAYDQKEIKLKDRESIILCGNFKGTGANNHI